MDRITSSRVAGILLISHSKPLSEQVSGALQDMGYDCVLNCSPRAGLTMASLAPWVIFFQARHPDMSGIQFAGLLREKSKPLQPSRLILLNEQPDYELAVRALRSGIDDILVTPISKGDVRRIIGSLDVESDERALEVTEPAVAAETEGVASRIRATLDATIASRSMRCQFFEEKNLIDPAWDILLDLTRARLSGVRLSASAVCTGIPRSMATGLRVLRTLEAEGLVVRTEDSHDRRRSFVELSESAFERMKEFLQRISVLF